MPIKQQSVAERVQEALLHGWKLKRVIVNRADYSNLLHATTKLDADPSLADTDPRFHGIPLIVSPYAPDGGVIEMEPPANWKSDHDAD